MEGISDIKIVGLDERRPPRIRKEPYIDLYFKLSHQAPSDWCNEFNVLMSKHPTRPKINDKEGLFIEAWVKKSDEIVDFFELLKVKVAECSANYIERIELLAREANAANSANMEESSEQGDLNRIIAALNYDDVKSD